MERGNFAMRPRERRETSDRRHRGGETLTRTAWMRRLLHGAVKAATEQPVRSLGGPGGLDAGSNGQKSAPAGDHWPDIFPSPLRGRVDGDLLRQLPPTFFEGARGPAEEMAAPKQVGLTFFNSPFSL